MAKFKNKYRIESSRLPSWDYSNSGYYFITIVTKNRDCILGDIKNGEIVLSDFGRIVNNEWLKSFKMRNELSLDKYVIMPNHLHAIVILENSDIDEQIDEMHGCRDARPCVSTIDEKNKFIRKPKSISSFIAGFKSAVNSKIDNYIDEHKIDIPKYNRYNHFFQPRFYDHIIRNESSHFKISNYIINNPLKWSLDSLHPDNNK